MDQILAACFIAIGALLSLIIISYILFKSTYKGICTRYDVMNDLSNEYKSYLEKASDITNSNAKAMKDLESRIAGIELKLSNVNKKTF